MPNIGMGELFMILVVGLLVFGPKRLPEIARNLGKAWRVFQDESRRAQAVLRDSLEEETRMLKDTMSEVGVIDHPDGARPRRAEPKGAPSPAAIEAAAAVEPAPERRYEDT